MLSNKNNIINLTREELENKGLFAINKPLTWTSNDVINFLKSRFKFTKVGHGGTLDPYATGVLIIAVEQHTKKLHHALNTNKKYDVLIQLGESSPSYDLGTEINEKKEVSNLTVAEIDNIIQKYFLLNYLQSPPSYSAKKINGVRAYQLARKNMDVVLQSVLVNINDYHINFYDEKTKIINISLDVSKGFYVRSFAHDLAIKLNTVGVVVSLIRTETNGFSLNDCLQIIKKPKQQLKNT